MANEKYFATVRFETDKDIDGERLDSIAKLYGGRKTATNLRQGMTGYIFHFEEFAEGFREEASKVKDITDVVVGKVS